jgi:hypothetical protein
MYFADGQNSTIRILDLMSHGPARTRTLVGKGPLVAGDIDGPTTTARIHRPLGLATLTGAYGGDYRIFIADSYNHKIRCLNVERKTVETIAGNGTSGYKDGIEAQFAEPAGLAFIGKKIYVADTNNNVIRVITLPSKIEPVSTSTLKLIWKR